jgi:hypothetical protein
MSGFARVVRFFLRGAIVNRSRRYQYTEPWHEPLSMSHWHFLN